MARMEVEGFDQMAIMQVKDADIRRTVVKKMLWAAGKVMEKELKKSIHERHHVVSGDMEKSVVQSEVHELIDGGYVEVYPQGTDSRGVDNYMKHKVINTGAWNKGSGHRWKKDKYAEAAEKRAEGFIKPVMDMQMQMSLKELGLTD